VWLQFGKVNTMVGNIGLCSHHSLGGRMALSYDCTSCITVAARLPSRLVAFFATGDLLFSLCKISAKSCTNIKAHVLPAKCFSCYN
jgi:hypothetical protein